MLRRATRLVPRLGAAAAPIRSTTRCTAAGVSGWKYADGDAECVPLQFSTTSPSVLRAASSAPSSGGADSLRAVERLYAAADAAAAAPSRGTRRVARRSIAVLSATAISSSEKL